VVSAAVAPLLQALAEDPLGMKGNDLPTVQVPATNGTGAVALPEPFEEPALKPALAPAAVAPAASASVAQGGGALFAVALALAVVATVAAVYLYLRVATLEREIRLLRENVPTQPR
jgi:hypothetical protein